MFFQHNIFVATAYFYDYIHGKLQITDFISHLHATNCSPPPTRIAAALLQIGYLLDTKLGTVIQCVVISKTNASEKKIANENIALVDN